jgi:hypothetical protein
MSSRGTRRPGVESDFLCAEFPMAPGMAGAAERGSVMRDYPPREVLRNAKASGAYGLTCLPSSSLERISTNVGRLACLSQSAKEMTLLLRTRIASARCGNLSTAGNDCPVCQSPGGSLPCSQSCNLNNASEILIRARPCTPVLVRGVTVTFPAGGLTWRDPAISKRGSAELVHPTLCRRRAGFLQAIYATVAGCLPETAGAESREVLLCPP